MSRVLRINVDIQRELSVLLRNIKDPRIKNQGLITITSVDTSGDLGVAKVYLSVMDMQSEKEFLAGLKSASGHLRSELGRVLSVRRTPELKFIIDDSIKHGARITRILNNL